MSRTATGVKCRRRAANPVCVLGGGEKGQEGLEAFSGSSVQASPKRWELDRKGILVPLFAAQKGKTTSCSASEGDRKQLGSGV